MACISPVAENARYDECVEDGISGINSVVQIIPIEYIQTFPALGTVGGQWNIFVITEMEKLLSAGGDIVLKENKRSVLLPCRFEKNNLVTESYKGGTKTSLSIQLQNTTHNRAVVEQIRKWRFIAVVKDLNTGEKIIIGRHELNNPMHAAIIDFTSVRSAWGDTYSSDRMTDFTISVPMHAPIAHYGRVKSLWTMTVTEAPQSLGGWPGEIIDTNANPIKFRNTLAYEAGVVVTFDNTPTYILREFETPSINYGGVEPNPELQNPSSVQMFLDTEGKLTTNHLSTNGGVITSGNKIFIRYYDEF